MTFDQPAYDAASHDRPVRASGISVIVPCYNEYDSIDELLTRLKAVADASAHTFEIICVNDGSADGTWRRLCDWAAKWDALKLVDLSRNFGKEIALMAGLDRARGGAVVLMDSDLQHPPELLREFIALWEQGHDVVVGVRRDRSADSAVRQTASRAFYRMFNMLSEVPISNQQGDFRLMDRRVVEAVKRMRERSRFMKGIYAWVGFGSVGVEFDVPERKHGKTSFSPRRLLNLAFDGMLSFSTIPLRIGVLLGCVAAAGATVAGIYYLIKTLILGVDVPGFASLMVATLLLSGITLAFLGLVGLYIGRIYEEVKGRPLYVVRRTEADIEVAKPRSVPGKITEAAE